MGTFLIDLFLFYCFVYIFKVQYLVATATAFIVAISINYVVSRATVFRQTERSLRQGYINFIGLAVTGMMITIGGMYILVSMLSVNYIYARVLVAGVVGIWNYLMNLYVNFKVVGRH